LIEKTKILIAAGEQSGTVALAIVLHAKHRADAGTLSAASNPMYGASVRIPMKSPGHSEMRSPGVRCPC
jgi:hypothetical protein